MPHLPRRTFLTFLLAAPFWKSSAQRTTRGLITDFGAIPDATTLNTKAIQSAIDHLAAHHGGTVIIPRGTFLSGALFFKPGVNLHLETGAILRCSTDMANFPLQRTRIEGHFEPSFNPALINATHCDGFQLTGSGTLDGAGRPIWDEFWRRRNAAPDPHNFPNLSIPRARLALIENSRNVTIDGITFKDSQFWNCHLYNNDGVTVRNVRFEVPDDYKQAPSTDGIDIDSSRNVTIDNCFFSVTDDCIACKGSKGPHALEDQASPPVEHIRVRNCTYKRGGGVLTLGSEATIVRDVVVENCRITGPVRVATLKLRADTPQTYEDITFRNITSEADAPQILTVQPWSQYFNLQGATPPHSIVRNLSLIDIKGHFNAFGTIRPNPGQTDITNILLKDFNVVLPPDHATLNATGVTNLKFQNVIVNGHPQTT